MTLGLYREFLRGHVTTSRRLDDRCTRSLRRVGFLRLWLAWLGLTSLIAEPLMARTGPAIANPTVGQVQRQFASPPADCRIMMRWWWFGPAVTKPELAREILAMKAAGIGGFEIIPVYPMALDDAATGIHNLPYLSSGFLDALGYAAREGEAQGMRADLTLTSGWPYGGSYLPVSLAAGMLRVAQVPVAAGSDSIPVPSISAGEKLLEVFQVKGKGATFLSPPPQVLPMVIRNGRLYLSRPPQTQETALFFISSRTGQQVKRPSVGAAGFVLDPYDRAAIEDHLRTVGDPMLKAFGKHLPYAVFSDSLEVIGADWTPNFLEQFQRLRGYDLRPYLPALIGNIGPGTQAIRHDWGKTLTDLAQENYLEPIQAWAAQHGTRFRSQNYGIPPVILSSNALVDLPEGEDPQWREFSAARWASSASHLYGNPVTSAETWTWLHSPAFRGTPLDMKAEADQMFLNGINQIVGHGWPYSPPSAGDPGWSFYAAGAWDDHNPWWFVMPQVSRYFQRISYAMRQGKPDNDVAVLLPTDDAWADFTPTNLSVSEQMGHLLGPTLIPQILDAGFNFDFIDSAAIAKAGIPYRAIILPGITRIPLSTYRSILAFAQRGGIVIATGHLPSKAPGWLHARTTTEQIRQLSHQMFHGNNARGRLVPNEQQLGSVLAHVMRPDVALTPQTHDIGFVHRKLKDGDLYFLANTSNLTRCFSATFRVHAKIAQWWNPDTGTATWAANGPSVRTCFAPYEARTLAFSANTATASAQPPHLQPTPLNMDLSTNWDVNFLRQNRHIHYSTLHSWTQNPSTRYYSGQAIYEKEFVLPASWITAGTVIHLDFGDATPMAPRPNQAFRALLISPVREAAEVYVNGRLAGSIWHPPYEVDVTKLLQPGPNHLRILVGNLAINEMAGRKLPDYRLLNLRYGERFAPQDMNNLQPIPSGILGHLHLQAYRETRASEH